MKYRYFVSSNRPNKDEIYHAQDAATQRRNYDAQARRERYLRDKAAGKTGFKGVQARTSNPYGNFASLYYDPKKAAEYYQAHKKTSTPRAKAEETKSASESQNEQPYEEEQQEQNNSSGGSGGSSGGSGGSGGGSEGSGGSGGSGGLTDEQRAEIAEIEEQIQEARYMTKEQKERFREDSRAKIEELKERLQEHTEQLKEAIESVKEDETTNRENAKEKASSDIENEQDVYSENLNRDVSNLKDELAGKNDPIREQNAALRGQIDSISDPATKARLKAQLAANVNQISKNSADYTNKISDVRTEHTTKMRTNIDTIRNDLNTLIQSSNEKQQSNVNSIRVKIADVRQKNRDEIASIREKLKSDLELETNRAKSEIKALQNKKKLIKGQDVDEGEPTDPNEYKLSDDHEEYEVSSRDEADKDINDFLKSMGVAVSTKKYEETSNSKSTKDSYNKVYSGVSKQSYASVVSNKASTSAKYNSIISEDKLKKRS